MAKASEPLLAAGDLALLRAAQTGEGAVPLTEEMLDDLMTRLQARYADIEARYPALVAACPYEMKLAVVAWAFKAIVDHAQEGGTFRYLIYHRLGFKPDAYVPLLDAGGMTISNEFDLAPPKDPAVLGRLPEDKE